MGFEFAMSTNTGARRTLRRLELEAYASVVSAFRAQGRLTGEKKSSLELLCKHFGISSERHRAEVRRAVNDDLLSSVANCITGTETDKAWRKEGQKLASTNPRFVSRQISHLPQVLTSAAITAALGLNKPTSSTTQGSADSAQVKKLPTSSSQLQSALKFIISQNPLASSKLSDVITSKNQSPVKQQSSSVGQTTSTDSVALSATKSGASPQKVVQKNVSSQQKNLFSPHKVTTTPQKVTTPLQKIATSKPSISKAKLQSSAAAKVPMDSERSAGAGKEVKTVSKIESLLCEETLTMDTSPSRDQKPPPLSVTVKASTTSITVQSKETNEEKASETVLAKPPVSVAEMLSAPLKEIVTKRIKEEKESIRDPPCEEKMSEENEPKKSSSVEENAPPISETKGTESEQKPLPADVPSADDEGAVKKDTSPKDDSVTDQTTVGSEPVTTTKTPPVSVSAIATSATPSSSSTALAVTSPSPPQIAQSSEDIKETRKRSPPPLSEDIPPPKKPNMAPLTLSLSQPSLDQTISKSTPSLEQLATPISAPPASSPIPATPPIPVPTTPLPVEVPPTPLTPASIQDLSEFDPTAENLIEALCSDPSTVDDSTLASQLGLDSMDTSVMNFNEFLNIIQPENVTATANPSQTPQLASSESEPAMPHVDSSTVAPAQPCTTSDQQSISTPSVKPSRAESTPVMAPSKQPPKTTYHKLPVMAHILPSTGAATSPLLLSSTPPQPAIGHLPKPEATPSATAERPVTEPIVQASVLEKTEGGPSKQPTEQLSSGLLDFTDIGSLLGSEDKLLEDIPQELAESIHALAMLDEKSTRVTWKQ